MGWFWLVSCGGEREWWRCGGGEGDWFVDGWVIVARGWMGDGKDALGTWGRVLVSLPIGVLCVVGGYGGEIVLE